MTPADLPWWWPMAVVPIALWMRDSLWPWLRGLIDGEFRARRDAAQTRRAAAETEYLEALTTWSAAHKEVAASLKTFSEVRVADNLILSRMERQLEAIESALARVGVMERRSRRKVTEAERGE